MFVMFVCGLVTVNVAHRGGGLIFYSGAVTAVALIGGLLTASLAASAGVLVSLRASTVRQAAQALSVGIMLCIFVPAFGVTALPASWKASFLEWGTKLSVREWVAVVCVVLALADAVLVAIAMARFKRARLILD